MDRLFAGRTGRVVRVYLFSLDQNKTYAVTDGQVRLLRPDFQRGW